MTWTESRWGRGTLAVALTIATACGDDDKKTDNPDGSTPPIGTFDSGTTTFDGGTITHLPDGGEVIISNDGSIISQPGIDGGGNSGNDAGGGGGNNGGCATDCNDGVDCTLDTCVSGACQHTIDVRACAAGSSCDPTKGCQQGAACSMNSECADTNACTINERCDQASKRCLFDPLDGDGDGYAPSSCMGTDCDDSNGLIHPNATEICDGVDSDCSGVADDHLTLLSGQTCSMGDSACTAGLTYCPGSLADPLGACRDLKTDAQHCGGCGTSCGNAGTCVDGKCSETCAAPAMQCGQYCSDLKTSNLNCGSCNSPCVGRVGVEYRTCIAGGCAPCGGEGQACCTSETAGIVGDARCNGALTCSGTPGAAGSTCGCAAPATKCGDACVDLTTDHDNCGACGTACTNAQACITDTHGTACVACGGLGQACCDSGNALPCRGGRICGPTTNTCIDVSTGNGGGNGR